jgi:hypothetical protein
MISYSVDDINWDNCAIGRCMPSSVGFKGIVIRYESMLQGGSRPFYANTLASSLDLNFGL